MGKKKKNMSIIVPFRCECVCTGVPYIKVYSRYVLSLPECEQGPTGNQVILSHVKPIVKQSL